MPVYLYGDLAGGRTRAELRRGGIEHIAPDAGPRRLHPTAGATLVAARPPLAAFNVEIDAPLATAKAIAAEIRTLPGVRALGLELPTQGIVQVSTNVEELDRTTPADVVAAVRRHATVTGAELVAPGPAQRVRILPGRRAAARRAAAGLVPSNGHGTDEAQAPDQAPRQRRGRRRVARPHRPPPDRGGAPEGDPRDRARAPDEQAAELEQRVPEGGADGRPAVRVHAHRRVRQRGPVSQSILLCVFALVLYTPLAYVTDRWVYQRAQRRKQQQK